MRKGTRIVINLWSLHHDEKEWKNPEVFDPGESLPITNCLIIDLSNFTLKKKKRETSVFSGGIYHFKKSRIMAKKIRKRFASAEGIKLLNNLNAEIKLSKSNITFK